MKLRVWRSGREGKDGRYELYEVEKLQGMTVLDALFSIRDEHDDSLSFRYSCRGAICGSCAMTINREPRLACRTQVSSIANVKPLGLRLFGPLEKQVAWDRTTEVLVEPLPNMPILKDLVVDMTKFFDSYRKIRPWMELPEGRFSRMTPAEASRIQKYTNCILCAACFGACPVNNKDTDYLGPAALAWSLRFIDDARTTDREARLALVADKNGAPDCEFIYNCAKVCPKSVAPAGAIRILRDRLKA